MNDRQGWFLHILPWRRRYEGETCPRGYRVAYIDFCRQEDICCPFGLHWIVRFFRRLWELSFWYRPSALERLAIDSYCEGKSVVAEAWRKCDARREAEEEARVHWMMDWKPEPLCHHVAYSMIRDGQIVYKCRACGMELNSVSTNSAKQTEDR